MRLSVPSTRIRPSTSSIPLPHSFPKPPYSTTPSPSHSPTPSPSPRTPPLLFSERVEHLNESCFKCFTLQRKKSGTGPSLCKHVFPKLNSIVVVSFASRKKDILSIYSLCILVKYDGHFKVLFSHFLQYPVLYKKSNLYLKFDF